MFFDPTAKLRQRLLRRILAAGLAAACGACSRPDIPQLGHSNPPRSESTLRQPLAFDDPEFSFGTVTQHDVLSHVFSFVNRWPNPVVITNVSEDSCCAQVIFPRDPIPAQGSGEIEVLLDTAKRQGPQLIALDVHLSGWDSSVARLQLGGFVEPIMNVDPSPVAFTDIVRSQRPVAASVTITHLGGNLWTVAGAELNSPHISVEAPTAPESRNRHELTVTFNPAQAPEKLTECLLIHTSLEENPAVVIPIVCVLAPPVQLYPPEFSFGRMVRGETKMVRVLVRSTEQIPFRIISAEASTRLVSVEFDDRAVGAEHRLYATLKASLTIGKLVGLVKVGTTLPGMEQLHVPMYGTVLSSRRAKDTAAASCCG